MFRINLLPDEERPQIRCGLRMRGGVMLALAALGLLLVSVVGTASWQTRTLTRLEAQAADLNGEAERYRPQIQLVNQLRSKTADLEQRLEIIRRLDRNREARISAMEELSDALPDYVWLVSFLESEDGVTVEGVAFSSLAVFEFMIALDATPRFSDVRLESLRRGEIEEQAVIQFTLSMALEEGQTAGAR